MANMKRIIRKVDRPAESSFDERLWPVNVALMVLGSFLVGMSLAYLRFDDSRWYANAWTSVIGVPLVVLSLMIALRFIQGRTLRRAAQLAAVVSAIIHCLFILMSLESTIFSSSDQRNKARRDLVESPPPVTIPEYAQHHFVDPQQRPQQDFEKPVEVEVPQRAIDEVARQDTQPDNLPRESQPIAVPNSQPTLKPNITPRSATSETAPRASEQSSQLSRRQAAPTEQPNQTVDVPQSVPVEKVEPAARRAESTAVARQATTSPVEAAMGPRNQPAATATTAVPSPTSATAIVARANRTDQPRETTSSPLARSTSNPRVASPAEDARVTATPAASSPEVAAARSAPAGTLAANATRVGRASPAAAAAQAREAEANTPPSRTEATAARPARANQASEQPTAESSAKVAMMGKSQTATPANVVTQPADVAANSAPQTAARIQPAPAAVAVNRQTATDPSTDRLQPARPQQAESAAQSVAPPMVARVNSAALPTIDPLAPVTKNPARAARTAAAEASPSPVESPALAQSKTPATDVARATKVAVSKSTEGMAGAGESFNLDRTTAASVSPALTASGAAQRAQASQNLPEGPALSPAAPASVRRSVAGADRPSATIQAEAAPNATMVGSSRPSELTASSSAAVTQSNSNAAPGPVTAAAGRVDVDLGPTTMVAEKGTGRASGGGQPTINFDTPTTMIERDRGGGGPQATIASRQAALVPVAPAGTGGGAPAAEEVQPQAVATARGSRSGEAASAGGPTSGAAAGPTELSTAAPLAAATRLSRAQEADGAAAGSNGGGQPTATDEDEETKARRLARAALGAQGIAGGANTSVTADAAGTAASGETNPNTGAAGNGDSALKALAATTMTRGRPLDGPARGTAGAAAERGQASASGATPNELDGVVTSTKPTDSPLVGQPGASPGRRLAEAGAEKGPLTPAALEGLAGVPRAAALANSPGNGDPVDLPAVPSEVAQATSDHVMTADGRAKLQRQATGAALNVDAAAAAGAGGLGSESTPDVGVTTRLASADSLQVQLRSARLLRQQVGGVPSTSTAAVLPTDSFRQRAGRVPGNARGSGSPPPETEETIERGLAFLARYQSPDGSWSLSVAGEEAALSSNTAATALALIAFQGAGYNHREHKYQQAVRAGLDHLVKNQRPDGDLFVPMDDESNRSVWLYSHSVATLALCEAYGMTQDPALKEPAQKAINFIVAAQHKQRGGWRYAPGIGADTSVSGWMLMAMKSGELSNLKVPPEAYQGIRKWLDDAQASPTQRHLYRYNPLAPDTPSQRHGREPTRTMTSVGLLMRLYTGWRRDQSDMLKGADVLAQYPPLIGTVRNPERDTYYWYYATQVMFHMGGKYWSEWNGRLHPLLTQSQVMEGPMAGSWEPLGPVPDRWAAHAGRLYVTTMNLLSLEVYYRHLPIYDDVGK